MTASAINTVSSIETTIDLNVSSAEEHKSHFAPECRKGVIVQREATSIYKVPDGFKR